MRFAWLGAGAALSLIVAAGCSSQGAPPGEKTSSTTAAIQGGTTDTTHTFAVGLCGGFGIGQCNAICSGALIAPNVVVTARHCVDQSPQQIICANSPTFGPQMWSTSSGGGPHLYVTTNTEMLAGSTPSTGWHDVKQIITPTDTHICGHDIALVVLKDLVPSSEATPIIPGVQYPMNDPQYSSKFVAVGFGNTSPANTGAGTRRLRTNIQVYCIPGDPLIDCPPNAGIDAAEFAAGDGTCEGDSGSSAYDTLSWNKGTPVSFGVLSRGGVSPDNLTCQGSLYTRLDAWRDLVVQTVTNASANWSLYPKPTPDWTVYVAPPNADAGADAKPTTTPSGLGIGEVCVAPADCASKQCAPMSDGTLICTATCTDSSTCPDGYDCSPDGLCMPTPPANTTPKTTTTTTSGCNVARDPQPTPWRGLGLAAMALGLAVARRRRAG